MNPKFPSPAQLARNFVRRLTVSHEGIFPQSDDVVLHIFEHVAAGDAADALTLARVCRSWRRLALDSSAWHTVRIPLRVPTRQRNLRQMKAWDRDWEALAGVTNLVRNEKIAVGTTKLFAFRVTGLSAEEDERPECWNDVRIRNAIIMILGYVAPGLRRIEFNAGISWQIDVLEAVCMKATPGTLRDLRLTFRDAADEYLVSPEQETPTVQRKLAALHAFLPGLEILHVDWPLDRLTVRQLLTGETFLANQVPANDCPENPLAYPYCFHAVPLSKPFVLPEVKYPRLRSLRLTEFTVAEGEEFSLTRYDTIYQLFAEAFPELRELVLDVRERRHNGGFRTFPFVYLDVLMREESDFIWFPKVERLVVARGSLQGDMRPVTEIRGLKDERSLVQAEGLVMVRNKFPVVRELEVRWRESGSRKLKVKKVNM